VVTLETLVPDTWWKKAFAIVIVVPAALYWTDALVDEVARARRLGGLSLETAEMAVANIRLYQRHGFEIVSRGPPDHGLDPHTRVYMVKSF